MTHESWHAASGGTFSSRPPRSSTDFHHEETSGDHDRRRDCIFLKMTFSVHVATIADCPALATVSLAAFKDDPIVGYYARNVRQNDLYAYQCQQYRRRFQTSSLNGLRVFKVVEDETGWVMFMLHIGIHDKLSTISACTLAT